ncbi:hypothetical protein E2C01_045251 [Portunus trituberculatus]|uniref:Uncharacterized protein n=1 Tax=Portunus trituberculatus TaxID=210409 RepID=A0A5B7G1I2_PORTR|nr:hypothetical protein [Portunus trituberculatus]
MAKKVPARNFRFAVHLTFLDYMPGAESRWCGQGGGGGVGIYTWCVGFKRRVGEVQESQNGWKPPRTVKVSVELIKL